jgi:hypothetical protein
MPAEPSSTARCGLCWSRGARAVVASLWPVADEIGARLMTELYRHLLHDSMSAPQALGAAMRSVVSDDGCADPALWAAFQVSTVALGPRLPKRKPPHMETRRLRHLQQPSRTETLLEALILRGYILPKDSYQIRDPKSLPSQLQVVVARAAQEGRVWACWATSHDTWLFTCEMSLPLSRERGSPVLLVNRYGEGGELTDSGSWAMDPEGKWKQLAD